jgi:tetratricopeptide (TPR) repeat protein
MQLTRSKRLLFNIILISFPVLFLLIMELFLRLIHYGDNYSLFLDFPDHDLGGYRYINPVIGKKYFRELEYTTPCGDMFLKEKPKNGFRIFVLGSSTVLGFPYHQNVMFSRILQERLQDSYPDKKVEVINTALTAINSFTLLDFTGDMLDEDADALLIYAGHNEFYGALGIGSVEKSFRSRKLLLLHEQLLSFRFYQLLRNAIFKAGIIFKGRKNEPDLKGTLMQRIAGNKEIGYKDDIYTIGIERYSKNLEQILRMAKHRKVPVFISELVSNIKDFPPFCSDTLNGYPAANDIYFKGKRYEREGKYDQAKEAYYLAKDLDCIRFRASEDINESVHKLAAKYNAHLVPMKTLFEDASPNKTIGCNLITEHLHPNIDGYFLMADAFYNEITGSNITGESLNPVYYKSSSYYRNNWGFTELDSLFALHQVAIITKYWPFQPPDATADLYKKTYRPESLADSLAFAVAASGAFKIDDAHRRLAEVYKACGDYYHAFREYYATIKYDPFQVKNYNDAVECLTRTNDLSLALKLLDRSLELKPTFYARGTRSEILFLKGDYEAAEKELDRASALDQSPNAKLQVLENLYKIQYSRGNVVKAQEVLNEIRKINPAFQPFVPPKKNYVNYIPVQVEGIINNALEHCKEGDLETGLKEFLQSLEIKETALANRCIGDILYSKHNSNAILYYQKAYPDYRSDIHFLYNLGVLYLQSQMTDKAEAVLHEIKKLNPQFEMIPWLEDNIRKQRDNPIDQP